MKDVQLSPQKSGGRILLVEDDDANRQMMADYLNYCGYEVLSVPDGAGFYRAMQCFQPQIILLDLRLPDVSGYTLLEAIQSRAEWSSIPVLVISAFAFHADQERALSLGAKRYFIKPLNLTYLRQVIQEEVSS